MARVRITGEVIHGRTQTRTVQVVVNDGYLVVDEDEMDWTEHAEALVPSTKNRMQGIADDLDPPKVIIKNTPETGYRTPSRRVRLVPTRVTKWRRKQNINTRWHWFALFAGVLNMAGGLRVIFLEGDLKWGIAEALAGFCFFMTWALQFERKTVVIEKEVDDDDSPRLVGRSAKRTS